MEIYTGAQKKGFILLIIAFLGIAIAFSMRNIFPAVMGAVILYVLFKPLYQNLIDKRKFKKWLSALLILVISGLLLILPFFFLSWLIVDKMAELSKHPEIIDSLVAKISSLIGSLFHDQAYLKNALKKIQDFAVGIFPSVVNSFFNILLLIALTYFLLYFMLVEHLTFEKALIKYLPFPEKNALQFGAELKNITYSNVVGHGLIALVQGVLQGFGFLIFGLPDPLFWGAVTVILCFLPVIGAPIIFVPAGSIAIAAGNTFGGIGILIWGFVLIVNIDNILLLFLAKKIGNIHPVITILGVIIGIPVFGILGLVFGPLLLSYFILLVKVYETRYIENNPQKSTEIKIKKE